MQVMQWCGSSRTSRRDRLREALTDENQLFKGWTETSCCNTDAWLSDSAVESLANFSFSPDVEDFDLRFQDHVKIIIPTWNVFISHEIPSRPLIDLLSSVPKKAKPRFIKVWVMRTIQNVFIVTRWPRPLKTMGLNYGILLTTISGH